MAAHSLYRRAIPAAARVTTWTGPDGWAFRRFDWPSARATTRGRLLFQGGRGDVFEKYLETFSHWHAKGWSVTSLDWRGQGGSGRLSPDPHVGHAADFAPWIADLATFWAAWAAEGAGPHVVVAHSMGGHLVLRALVEEAFAPDAAVLVAPMLGLHSPVGARFGERLARVMARLGDPARAAWKANERPASITSRQALLTHDPDRYSDEQWWYAATPEIRLGPPSWDWLVQAFASTRALRDDRRLATVTTPLLMLVAEADRLVDARAAAAVAARLPTAELITFGRESAHEILREGDEVRDKALAAIDRFLDAEAPRA